MWGFFLVYYKLMDLVLVDFVVVYCILWLVLFVGLFFYLCGCWGEVVQVFCDLVILKGLIVLVSFIVVNWLVFVWVIVDEWVFEVLFGYFINLFVSIIVGLVILKEWMLKGQWFVVGIVGFVVVLQVVFVGGLFWVFLILVFFFVGYGYVCKVIFVKVIFGFFVEIVLLFLFVIGYFLFSFSWGCDVMVLGDILVFLVFVGIGIVIVLLLIFFFLVVC